LLYLSAWLPDIITAACLWTVCDDWCSCDFGLGISVLYRTSYSINGTRTNVRISLIAINLHLLKNIQNVMLQVLW
jgi:hypothetical protein